MLLASLWWLESHQEDAPTQSRLAGHAGVDPMMSSQVIRRLEAVKLLERHVHPVDARARQLRLTPAGRVRLSGALADVEATDEAYFATLDADRAAFAGHLARLDAQDR